MRVDLHLHTTASDGLLEPAALVSAVRAASLQVFSVTDHDTVDALPEVEAQARAFGLRLIPGIELSALWHRVEFHILGYFVDPADAAFLAFLQARREARRTRLQAMLNRLRALGMAVEADEVLARAQDGNVGRPHVARVLVERGFVASTDEAFERYLGDGRPAYVPRPDVTVAEAIRAIHDAGGLASLAHPGLHNRDDAIPDLVLAGLDAIEAYHVCHSAGITAHYRRLAERRRLLVTGGSDFHGGTGRDHGPRPGMPCLPEAEFARLEAAVPARRAATGN
ncbi:MAG TPA: PHP domain-containing protein [Candidatus Methylomirabilis sp.]|nr:PHP domain-containing protein [Candidatus Methylomirabilis sp.]